LAKTSNRWNNSSHTNIGFIRNIRNETSRNETSRNEASHNEASRNIFKPITPQSADHPNIAAYSPATSASS
jgi:hypothetical protein